MFRIFAAALLLVSFLRFSFSASFYWFAVDCIAALLIFPAIKGKSKKIKGGGMLSRFSAKWDNPCFVFGYL
jgi:hypothetical protein